MKNSGNDFVTLWRKLYFMLLPSSGRRTRYINRHKYLFHHVGSKLFFQPRQFPSDPELISIGDNVMIASGVRFINHDIISVMLNRKYNTKTFSYLMGGVKIGNNVMIGANSLILPDVAIGDNVVIAAGSVVTKDIPSNSVVGGVPAKYIGDFDTLADKRRKYVKPSSVEDVWLDFELKRNDKK